MFSGAADYQGMNKELGKLNLWNSVCNGFIVLTNQIKQLGQQLIKPLNCTKLLYTQHAFILIIKNILFQMTTATV